MIEKSSSENPKSIYLLIALNIDIIECLKVKKTASKIINNKNKTPSSYLSFNQKLYTKGPIIIDVAINNNNRIKIIFIKPIRFFLITLNFFSAKRLAYSYRDTWSNLEKNLIGKK